MKPTYFNALAASIGSGLEYFSFITFALQAQYLGILFFPKDSHLQGILNTFLIFAVGSFVTVIGGCLFGYLGDRVGRKATFIYAILLMSAASLGIAILPTSLGMVSLGLLILFRTLQGISQGAELPGAITFIVEHAKDHNRGLACGIMFLGVGLGAGLATSVNVLITHILSFEQMLSFGWRIPFFAAMLLGLVGLRLRRKALETPVFLAMKIQSYRVNFTAIIHGFGLVLLGAVLVSLGLYWPALLSSHYHFAASDIFLAMMLAFIITAFFLPLTGYLGDRFGRGIVYLVGVILCLIVLPLLFANLEVSSKMSLIIFALGYYTLIVILAGNYPVMLTELFKPEQRYFSVALSYAGCYAVASLAPALAAFLLLHSGNLQGLYILIFSAALISLLAGIGYCRIKVKY